MFDLRISRSTVGLVLFGLVALLILLLSSVHLAGAASQIPDQENKSAQTKVKLDTPLDVKGQLQDNDAKDPVHNQPCKTYMVKLKKGKTYIIDMVSKDFDSYLRLETAQGNQLAEDDDSGGDLNAQILFAPEADGSFKVIATRFEDGTGNFTLRVHELTYKIGKTQPLTNGELKLQDKLTTDDPIDPVGPKHAFKIHTVKMTAGRTYTIDLASDAFDAFLRLSDAQFKKLAEDDDSGGGLNSRIVFRAKTDGLYHIVATSLDGQLGDYTLTVREAQ
jgi:serine protease Do